MNFRACSSVSRHVLCLICVIFYDGPPYIFMIELVNIIHISIHMLHKKKFGFRLLFLLFFHSLSISSWLSVYPSLFLSVNIWISGIGVCLYFFWAHICMVYYILMLYFRIFAHIFAVQMEYAVISFEFIVGYLP